MWGLGLIDRNLPDDSRSVIVLEEVDPRETQSEPQEQAIKQSQEKEDGALLGSVNL